MVAALPTPAQEKQRRIVNPQPRPHLSARLHARWDDTTRLLAVKITRLQINDLLVEDRLKLEWIQLGDRRYYLLRVGKHLRGKVEVRTASGRPSREKVARLAAVLALYGFNAGSPRVDGGVERLPSPRRLKRVPNLFTLVDGR